MYWLGIDIGTGGTRALLVDERGAAKCSYGVRRLTKKCAWNGRYGLSNGRKTGGSARSERFVGASAQAGASGG